MAFYVDLYKSGLAPPLDASGLVNLYQQFAEGYFAMVITGPWNLGEFRSRIPADQQDRWATAPLPPPEAGAETPGASIAGGSSLVLFRGSRHPDAAWKWVEFLEEPEQQARFYQLSGDLPSRRSVWETTGLFSESLSPGWIAVTCASRAMAEWLGVAIVVWLGFTLVPVGVIAGILR